MSLKNTVQYNQKLPSIEISKELLSRAKKRIPACTQTLAKGPTQYVQGVAPIYLQKGKGSRVWDVDGNEYIDFTMGLGPISLGYSYERINQALFRQIEQGTTFSLMHPLEVEVAELIHSIIPNAERIRFSKTGCDATSAAVRLARAFTGRKKIVCCGYHGWHDWYIGKTDRAKGIPEEVKNLSSVFVYNDLSSLESLLDSDTAAVIMEPMIFEEPREGFLLQVKELCRKNGSLLIFDEMWTGFRFALGGAQEVFDVTADLMTYSKAIANGMPISVLAGRADVMDLLEKEVFFFTTFGGEALSLTATKETILEMKEKKVHEHLYQIGKKLKDGYNEIVKKMEIPYTHCIGHPSRTLIVFTAEAGDGLEAKSLMQQELIRRGILWTGQHAISFSHTELEVEYVLSAYEQVLDILAAAVKNKSVREKILGEPVQPAFRTFTGTPMKSK